MGRRKCFFLFLFLFFLLPPGTYFLLMPDTAALQKKNPGKTALMKIREMEWKEKRKGQRVYQVWVPLAKISPFLTKAVLIAEDDKFWNHEGFDYEGIQKALERDLKKGKFKYGGSTISQQLVKNLYLSPKRSILRKFAEVPLTWKLERTVKKRRILEIYLNVVEWGEGIFGAEAAARHYFGTAALDLTSLQAARLAAVLPNPRKYSPVRDQKYVVNRARRIHNIMTRRGITEEEE